MPSKLPRILFAAALTGLLSLGSHSLYAADYPFMEKLKQCETAYKASRNQNLTRAEGTRASEEHLILVIEILKNLNKQSIAAGKEGRPLTPEELSINSRVMGHLVHMLAINQLAPEPSQMQLVDPSGQEGSASGDPYDWLY